MEIQKSEPAGVTTFTTEFSGRPLVIEVGRLANQASGSCTVRFGETVVLATAVISDSTRDGINYFPLTVDYEERLYAAGIIKGSRWVKREGRPSDEVVQTSRLVDRSIRPLFPKGIKNDVQVIITVLSFDQENDPDAISLVAASLAVAISPIPWDGPIAGLRVGRVSSETDPSRKEWVINPSIAVREKSDLDMIIAGTGERIMMVEAGAQEVPEGAIYEAVEFSSKPVAQLVSIIQKVVAAVGKPKVMPAAPVLTEGIAPDVLAALQAKADAWVDQHAQPALFGGSLTTKSSRAEVVDELAVKFEAELVSASTPKDQRKLAAEMFRLAVEGLISKMILQKGVRVDGRALTQVRPLGSVVGMLPRTHGSGLFHRGETQVLSVVTLGSPGDVQLLENLEGESKKRYMHHYNFPPFSVGETGRLGSPGRREIGHGMLAERALLPVLPPKEEFPYTIRVVSEVLSSNGSSSMGATCGSTLALMDAGVPITKPVAGVAMGVATDAKGNYKIITDLQDLEDGLGGMDFKIAGTRDGITAIQMDTKTKGLTLPMVRQTLDQAREGRLAILDVMQQAIAAPRPELSPYAPRIVTVQINPDRIRDVIGPGGKIINKIIDETGCDIDIEPDGRVMITGTDLVKTQKAVDWVKLLTKEVTVGETYEGKVTRILDFGAFVEVTPNKEGMVHISELAHYRVNQVTDVVKIGDTVKVKVIAIDDLGRVNLSVKALLPPPEGGAPASSDDRGYDQPRRPMRPHGPGRGGPHRGGRRF
ncbi:MAG: polyribonucleotide nucleotidyltransferase [Parcubacteria group bacterium Gr01-1014_31]|nr:MAG: polyribonucleotide nucleotidyltransferase [Parcubacteria group bacterium Gr01-1014_31]